MWAMSVILLCMATCMPHFREEGDEQDRQMRMLAVDIAKDLDLWGRRFRLTRGPCMERTSRVWQSAAVGLQVSPGVRLPARRVSQILGGH